MLRALVVLKDSIIIDKEAAIPKNGFAGEVTACPTWSVAGRDLLPAEVP